VPPPPPATCPWNAVRRGQTKEFISRASAFSAASGCLGPHQMREGTGQHHHAREKLLYHLGVLDLKARCRCAPRNLLLWLGGDSVATSGERARTSGVDGRRAGSAGTALRGSACGSNRTCLTALSTLIPLPSPLPLNSAEDGIACYKPNYLQVY
jgi:hypothetical protein